MNGDGCDPEQFGVARRHGRWRSRRRAPGRSPGRAGPGWSRDAEASCRVEVDVYRPTHSPSPRAAMTPVSLGEAPGLATVGEEARADRPLGSPSRSVHHGVGLDRSRPRPPRGGQAARRGSASISSAARRAEAVRRRPVPYTPKACLVA